MVRKHKFQPDEHPRHFLYGSPLCSPSRDLTVAMAICLSIAFSCFCPTNSRCPITLSLILFCQEVCPGSDLCIASLSEVTTIRTLSGVRDVTSAINCKCIPRERDCQRISSEQVFFKGTKFETRVDVGQCIGRCRLHGKSQCGLRFYEHEFWTKRCGFWLYRAQFLTNHTLRS